MSELLYKKWIPVQYQPNGEFLKLKVEGTGIWEKEFTHFGTLIHWGVAYEEFDTGPGNYTIAIVKNPDGTLEQVLPSNIKFLTGKEIHDCILELSNKKFNLKKQIENEGI